MGKAKNVIRPRWLIVSYYANVDGRAASHHIDDRLPALRRAGIDATVLSSTLGPRHKNEQHIRVMSLWPSAILDELKAGAKRNRTHHPLLALLRLILQIAVAIPLALLSVVERKLFHRDKRWSWQFTAAARGWVWCKIHQPDIILSTGGPACSHEAALWLSRRCKLPLVCEFQDPLPFQYPPTMGSIHDHYLKLEAQLARRASALIYLTDGAAIAASRRLGVLQQGDQAMSKCVAILSGAAENRLAPKPTNTIRTFAHIGTLSDTRNLDALLEALTRLIESDASIRDHFFIRLAGTLGKSVVQSIASVAFSDRIESLGRMPRHELDDVLADADILLLVQNTGTIAAETIPSKAFEYLQTGRPILALIGDNPQLRSVLENHGHVVYGYDENIDVLQHQLRQLIYQPLVLPKTCDLTVEKSVKELVSCVKRYAG